MKQLWIASLGYLPACFYINLNLPYLDHKAYHSLRNSQGNQQLVLILVVAQINVPYYMLSSFQMACHFHRNQEVEGLVDLIRIYNFHSLSNHRRMSSFLHKSHGGLYDKPWCKRNTLLSLLSTHKCSSSTNAITQNSFMSSKKCIFLLVQTYNLYDKRLLHHIHSIYSHQVTCSLISYFIRSFHLDLDSCPLILPWAFLFKLEFQI